jgi:hypothetical protein
VLGYSFSNKREYRSNARALILSTYAGMHAQRLVDPDAPDFHGESDGNLAFEISVRCQVFPQYCDRVGDTRHREYLDRLSGEARLLVKRHGKVIEKFAELLLQRKELEGAEAEEFIQARMGR